MNDQSQSPGTRDAARWLAEGPDRAPSGLLGQALDRTRRSGQRPRWLAAALGAPSVAHGRRLEPAVQWLLIGVLLLAAAMTIALAAGMSRLDLLAVAPTRPPASGPVASTRPVASPQVVNIAAGLSVTSNQLDPWTDVGAGWSNRAGVATDSLDFQFGACTGVGCDGSVISVAVSPVDGDGIVVGWDAPCSGGTFSDEDAIACAVWQVMGGQEPGGPVTITGRTNAELAAAFVEEFGGPSPRVQLVNGVRWAIGEGDDRLIAFVVAGDRLVSVTSQPSHYLSDAALGTRLQRFLAGIQFEVLPVPDPTPTPSPVPTYPVTTRWLGLELTLPANWAVADHGTRLTITEGQGMFGPGQWFDIQRVPLGTTVSIDRGSGLPATQVGDGHSRRLWLRSKTTSSAAASHRPHGRTPASTAIGWSAGARFNLQPSSPWSGSPCSSTGRTSTCSSSTTGSRARRRRPSRCSWTACTSCDAERGAAGALAGAGRRDQAAGRPRCTARSSSGRRTPGRRPRRPT
jgi:hypothetical protein